VQGDESIRIHDSGESGRSSLSFPLPPEATSLPFNHDRRHLHDPASRSFDNSPGNMISFKKTAFRLRGSRCRVHLIVRRADCGGLTGVGSCRNGKRDGALTNRGAGSVN
jgi:hypothetical protein